LFLSEISFFTKLLFLRVEKHRERSFCLHLSTKKSQQVKEINIQKLRGKSEQDAYFRLHKLC